MGIERCPCLELFMQSVVRKIQFCYGHRIMNHESKCANLHGHNALIYIHVCSINGLDDVGRVVDFSVVKDICGKWIDDNWDHTMIICKDDKDILENIKNIPTTKEVFVFDKNPTAENMVKFLLWEQFPKLLKDHGIMAHKMTFWETENCYVEETVDLSDPAFLSLYS